MGPILKTIALLIMPPLYLTVFAFAYHHRYQEYAGWGGLGVTGVILLASWIGFRKSIVPGAKWLLAGTILLWVTSTILAFISWGALIHYALAAWGITITVHLWMLSQAWSSDGKLRITLPLLAGVVVGIVTVGFFARYVVGHIVQVRQQIVRQLPYEVVPLRAGEDPNCREIRFYLSPPEMTKERELYIYASVRSASIAQWLDGRKPTEARLVFDLVFNFDEVYDGGLVQIDDRELRSLSHCTSSYLLAEEFKRGSYSSGPSLPPQYQRLDADRWYWPLVAPVAFGVLVIMGQLALLLRRSGPAKSAEHIRR